MQNSGMNFIPCRLLQDNARLLIDMQDFKIPLPPGMARNLDAVRETEFIFGIRPEDFREKDQRSGVPGEKVGLKATVNVIEPLGKEINIDLSTGVHNLTAVLNADTKATLHHPIELTMNMEQIHLFRKKGGEAVF